MDVGWRLDPGRHVQNWNWILFGLSPGPPVPTPRMPCDSVTSHAMSGVIPTLGSRSGDAVCILYLLDAGSQDRGELSGSGFVSGRVERFGCWTVGKHSRVCSTWRSGIEVYCGQD